MCSNNRSPDGVTDSRQSCLYSIEPSLVIVERMAFDKLVCKAVGAGEVAPLNRVNESSFKLRADNFCGCDLLAEDDFRRARFDKSESFWPEVALVVDAFTFAGATKGLAGAGHEENRSP